MPCSGTPIVAGCSYGVGTDPMVLDTSGFKRTVGHKSPIPETNNKIQLTMKRKKKIFVRATKMPNGDRGQLSKRF